MKTSSLVTAVVVAVLGVTAWAVPVAIAKDGDYPGLLTGTEVKQLVANARTPADHMKLNRHFVALSAKYEAEAEEHAALADVYRKPPQQRPRIRAAGAPGTARHCDELVRLSRRAAREALKMADDHERMATALTK